MAIKQIPAIHSTNELLNRFMSAVQSINSVLACPLLNGNLIGADLLASGPTDVAHKLGRRPQGYFIVGASGNISVWTVGAADNLTIPLQSSVDGSVNLWIF